MSPETQEKLDKVRKYSRSLSRVFRFFGVMFVVVSVAGLIFTLLASPDARFRTTIRFADVVFTGEAITPAVKVAATIAWLIVFGVVMKLIFHLCRLFDCYARGEIFTAETVRQIRAIGISVFLFIWVWACQVIARAVLDVPGAVSDASASGLSVPGASIGTPDPIGAVLTGTMIVLISWIMDVGREMREDQDLTV